MSNLLEKASILLTPTAYDDGKILSVKPVPSLGNELITNGDFATDSDWTKGTGWTISGGNANANNASGELSQSGINFDTGKLYKVQYTISGYLGFGSVQARLKGAVWNTGLLRQSDGTFTETILCTAENFTLAFVTSSSFTGSIDNVSVKEDLSGDFDFTRNSSATRVNSQGLIEDMQTFGGNLVTNGDFSQEGSELITNGDFATDTNWTKGTGWSISGGKGIATNTSIDSIYQNALTLSKSYKASFTISSIESGSLKIGIGINFSQEFTEVGTYTYYGTPSNDGLLRITPSNGTKATIDNVSVKEVGQDWTLGTGWSIGDNKVSRTAQSGSTSTYQSFSFTANKSYKITYDLDISGGSFLLRIGGGVLIDTTIRTTSGTYTEYILANSGNNVLNLRAIDGSFNGSITNISVIEITDDTNLPRIDYSPYSGAGTCGHWLFEPQSTNLITQSELFSDAIWLNINSTDTSNYGISPDGLNNSTRFLTTANISSYLYINSLPILDATNYTLSFWVKSNGNSLDKFRLYTVTGGTSLEFTSTNKWVRYEYNFLSTGTTTNLGIRGVVSQETDVQIWGAQLEQNSYPTSYIPTNGSTVTRNQEAAFGAGNSSLINSTEGVLYFEGSFSQNGRIALINTSSSDQIVIGRSTSIFYRIKENNVNIITDFFSSANELNRVYKIAVKYQSGNCSIFVDGIKQTDTNTFSLSGLSKIQFVSEGSDFFGKTKALAVFKEALTDDELECLTSDETSFSSFNALALANNYTII